MIEVNAIDPNECPDRSLAQTWHMLSGQVREFIAQAPAGLAADGHCVVMPVSVLDNPPSGAVLLSLSDSDAHMVASNLFGVDVQALSVQDVEDACREVCNVLSSCVIRRYAQDHEVTLGLPALVPTASLPQVADAGAVMDLFESQLEGRRMQVAVLSHVNPVVPELRS